MSDEEIDITYDEQTDVYRTTNPKAWNPSTTILIALEQIEGRDVTEFPPLNSFIDVCALNTLFGDRSDGTSRRGGQVTFRYEGYEVRVYDHGTITLSPQQTPSDTNAPSRPS